MQSSPLAKRVAPVRKGSRGSAPGRIIGAAAAVPVRRILLKNRLQFDDNWCILPPPALETGFCASSRSPGGDVVIRPPNSQTLHRRGHLDEKTVVHTHRIVQGSKE